MPNAAATPKQPQLLTVTAFFAVPVKFQQWEAAEDKWRPYKPPLTTQRGDLACTQIAPTAAGAIMIFCR